MQFQADKENLVNIIPVQVGASKTFASPKPTRTPLAIKQSPAQSPTTKRIHTEESRKPKEESFQILTLEKQLEQQIEENRKLKESAELYKHKYYHLEQEFEQVVEKEITKRMLIQGPARVRRAFELQEENAILLQKIRELEYQLSSSC
mmetsp:Transcript_1555/g.2058  ORF Transcript_1555/g.2058 Transcript_1555/m.2058 type:complete len:148 (-) Transcript_1555:89-532(-)